MRPEQNENLNKSQSVFPIGRVTNFLNALTIFNDRLHPHPRLIELLRPNNIKIDAEMALAIIEVMGKFENPQEQFVKEARNIFDRVINKANGNAQGAGEELGNIARELLQSASL